jgi:hypothetical protein
VALRLVSEEAQVASALAHAAHTGVVPANLDPPLADAAQSEAEPFYDGCLLTFLADTPEPCVFGDTSASATMVLLGDSHATQWFPALDLYANAHHLRLVVDTKATCPAVDVSIFSPLLGRTYTECDTWRAAVVAGLAAVHPRLVVLGTAPNYDSAYDIVQDGPAWLAGQRTLIRQLEADGSRVVVLGPVPSPPQDIPDCVSAHLDDVTACDVPDTYGRDGIGLVGYDLAGLVAERANVTAAGGFFVNVRRWFCTAATCPVVVDNLLVYRDNSHLTIPWATYLEPLVADELTLAGRRAA